LKLDTFLSAGNNASFHDKKPGAVTRPGICIALNYNYFYRNHVTLSSKNYSKNYRRKVAADERCLLLTRPLSHSCSKHCMLPPGPRPSVSMYQGWPAVTGRFIAEELARWTPIIKATGFKME
jgi:hypothetical protein